MSVRNHKLLWKAALARYSYALSGLSSSPWFVLSFVLLPEIAAEFLGFEPSKTTHTCNNLINRFPTHSEHWEQPSSNHCHFSLLREMEETGWRKRAAALIFVISKNWSKFRLAPWHRIREQLLVTGGSHLHLLKRTRLARCWLSSCSIKLHQPVLSSNSLRWGVRFSTDVHFDTDAFCH